MKLDRRRVVTAAGACLAGCAAGTPRATPKRRLDTLLAAHADELPERSGAGANHYPMAAEALEALGYEEAIDPAWVEGASLYTGIPGREGALSEAHETQGALGRYERYGDWLDLFRARLATSPWRAVLRQWTPRLAPGLVGATFHGLLRTGHAVRALGVQDTAARRGELACGLAYWASRYTELPRSAGARSATSLRSVLTNLEHPWLDDRSDVDFFSVVGRLEDRPLPSVKIEGTPAPVREELDRLVHEAATAFLEMLVAERHRIWLLHTVTGPAAIEWLLPEVDEGTGRMLVEHGRHAVVSLYAAFGEPYVPRASVRDAPGEWEGLVRRVVETRSVHGIKLIDALMRFDRGGDGVWRSVAEEWLEWT